MILNDALEYLKKNNLKISEALLKLMCDLYYKIFKHNKQKLKQQYKKLYDT